MAPNDTEAYLWARKAAVAGLAKAEYAMGYYTQKGIGIAPNIEDAKRWYWRAAGEFLFLATVIGEMWFANSCSFSLYSPRLSQSTPCESSNDSEDKKKSKENQGLALGRREHHDVKVPTDITECLSLRR